MVRNQAKMQMAFSRNVISEQQLLAMSIRVSNRNSRNYMLALKQSAKCHQEDFCIGEKE